MQPSLFREIDPANSQSLEIDTTAIAAAGRGKAATAQEQARLDLITDQRGEDLAKEQTGRVTPQPDTLDVQSDQPRDPDDAYAQYKAQKAELFPSRRAPSEVHQGEAGHTVGYLASRGYFQ